MNRKEEKPRVDIYARITDRIVADLEKATVNLEHAMAHEAEGGVLDHSKHYRDEVVPAMVGVRKVADALEAIISDDLWPLPTYQEMLFIK